MESMIELKTIFLHGFATTFPPYMMQNLVYTHNYTNSFLVVFKNVGGFYLDRASLAIATI